MYTRFHDDTIITDFIKQLVATTNVPFISTWKPGDFAICGMLYITRDAIYRCNHTGFPESITDKCEVNENNLVKDRHSEYAIAVDSNNHDNTKVDYFTKICPYIFGESYFNVTGSYISKIQGYDSETHFYLGQYLRMMRDLFDLDLMPFYNCYADDTVADVDFDSSGNVSAKKCSSAYKVLSVPVRFGKTYTIAINSELPVEMISVIYGKKGIIKSKTDNLNDIGENDRKSTYRKYNRMSFSNPITYDTKDWHQLYQSYVYGQYGKILSNPDGEKVSTDNFYDQGLGQYERYLRLLIKLPVTNQSSVVVLEGSYDVGQSLQSSNTDSVTFTNQSIMDMSVNSRSVGGTWERPEIIINREIDKGKYLNVLSNQPMLSPLGLLQMSDGNIYAFSNRLVEYLLQNAINPLETFGKNIQRVQEYASSVTNLTKNGRRYTQPYVNGVWDDSLREFLFNLCKDSKYLSQDIDLCGYVDKDTEMIVTRGQKV